MKTIAIVSIGIAATTLGLSSLGFSEAPKAVENAPEIAQKPGQPDIEAKLRQTIIPRIDFEDTSLEEAIDFLRLRGAEIDPPTKGMNFVIQSLPEGSPHIAQLRLRNAPLGVVLKYVCEATKMTYVVDEYAVTITPIVD